MAFTGMAFTEEEIALVRRSLARLRDRLGRGGADPFGPVFYARLFERLPEAAALFRSDLGEQGMRFLATLEVVAGALDRPGDIEAMLTRLGTGHAALGVRPEHFAPMWEALAETMRAALGERFDAATEAAWARAFALVAGRMQAAAPD